VGLITYHVSGTLIDASSSEPMRGYAIIAETGIDDEQSPLRLHAINAGDRPTDGQGCFAATFFTTGFGLDDSEPAPVPQVVEVHIEFAPGQWRCRVVGVEQHSAATLSNREIAIDLGQITVDYDKCRPPTGT
jgi:hypothetical protein